MHEKTAGAYRIDGQLVLLELTLKLTVYNRFIIEPFFIKFTLFTVYLKP